MEVSRAQVAKMINQKTKSEQAQVSNANAAHHALLYAVANNSYLILLD